VKPLPSLMKHFHSYGSALSLCHS